MASVIVTAPLRNGTPAVDACVPAWVRLSLRAAGEAISIRLGTERAAYRDDVPTGWRLLRLRLAMTGGPTEFIAPTLGARRTPRRRTVTFSRHDPA
jgi:hypothetical protein